MELEYIQAAVKTNVTPTTIKAISPSRPFSPSISAILDDPISNQAASNVTAREAGAKRSQSLLPP